MNCKKCGTENEDYAKFCGKCGARLIVSDTEEKSKNTDGSSDKTAVISDEEPIEIKSIHGDSSPESSKFSSNNTKNSAGKTAAKFLCIFLAIAALLVGVYLFKENQYKAENSEVDEFSENSYTDGCSVDSANEEYTDYPSYNDSGDSIPYSLSQYADGLVKENAYYVVRLSHDDWFVNVRSSPVYLISSKQAADNVIGKIQSGTTVYAEYIYDDMWVVFQQDGEYVFACMYDSADRNKSMIIVPADGY